MTASLEEKVTRYREMFGTALEATSLAPGQEPEFRETGEEFLNMARSYFYDGIHFHQEGDLVNALVCFSYGHAWLDAGLRLGVFEMGARN